jgi:aryl-alcohol dehydrogenase-like predicted oxidoreductase
MKIQRREFVKRAAFGLGGILAGMPLANAAETKPAFFDPYETVPLGQSKLKVSRFCLGTGMRGGDRQSDHTRMGKAKFETLIQGAYERGIRTFDTADLYGTHPYLLPALKGIPRDKVAIFTKIWFHSGGLPKSERPAADVVVPVLKNLRVAGRVLTSGSDRIERQLSQSRAPAGFSMKSIRPM